MHAQATANNLSATTHELVAAYGNTAKNLIHVYRATGERLVNLLDQRWDSALRASAARLTPEVQQNAQAAHRVFGGYCTKGLNLTTEGATTAVNHVVQWAVGSLDQAAANAHRFEEKTGLPTLNKLAEFATPAAQAVTRMACQLEEKSGKWLSTIAGTSVKATAGRRATPFKAARARKAP